MDAGIFRWVLIAIAVALALAIYLFGLHQARVRNQDALENFDNDDLDAALVDDDRIRDELINLSTVVEANEFDGSLDEIQINPSTEAQSPELAMDSLDEMRIDPTTEDSADVVAENDLFNDDSSPEPEDELPVPDDRFDSESDIVVPVDTSSSEDNHEDDPHVELETASVFREEEVDSVASHEFSEDTDLDEESWQTEKMDADSIDSVLHEALESVPENLDEDWADVDGSSDLDEDTDLDLEPDELGLQDEAGIVEDLDSVNTTQVLKAGTPLKEAVRKDDKISPAKRIKKWFHSTEAEEFVSPELADKNPDRLISYHLRHEDLRLIVGEEAEAAAQHAGLELSPNGLLECYEEDELVFQIVSLSAPGNFFEIEDLEFVTLGFNCFIDLDSCSNPRLAYEVMLKKIDELVRVLGVMVYTPDNELLSINEVADTRGKLA